MRMQACSQAGAPHQTTTVEVEGGEHLGILSSDKLLEELKTILELDPDAHAQMQDASASTVAEICAQAQPEGPLRTLGSRALSLASWGREAWGSDTRWLQGQGHCR